MGQYGVGRTANSGALRRQIHAHANPSGSYGIRSTGRSRVGPKPQNKSVSPGSGCAKPRSRVYRGLRGTRYLGLHVFSKECLCITRNVLIRKKLFCEVRRMRPQVAENFADRLCRSKDPKEEGGRVDTRGTQPKAQPGSPETIPAAVPPGNWPRRQEAADRRHGRPCDVRLGE
jgi:hypothetical protein